MNGPEQFKSLELISLDEIREIRRIWVFEKHEFEDTVPGIYYEIMGKELDDPEWIRSEAFGKEEWDILKNTCEELFPNEKLLFELMYSVLDVENNANGLNQRKGVLDTIAAEIRKNYYRDEKDATEFYSQKLSRKKDLGGKYNERFFNRSKEESVSDSADGWKDVDE